MTEDNLALRRRQNLAAHRVSVSAVTPSIRSFAQAIDRQRRSVERIPVLRASRQALLQTALALDEAEVAALALVIDDPAAELPLLAQVARAVSVPVLRADLLLEEFQIYESRAAGADAVLLHAALLSPALLLRLCGAARSTHMAACIACVTPAEVLAASAAKAELVALSADESGQVPEALLAALPRRMMALALPAGFALGGRAPVEAGALAGRADALLDAALGESADPAAAFRRHLEE